MPSAPRITILLALSLALLTFQSCLARRRLIAQQGNPKRQTLITATREELEQRLTNLYNEVKSFSATVDMTPAVGSVYQGSITEYKDVLAYILFKKPQEVRIIGKYPVVRSTAFDMASDGVQFHIYLPSKNRFLEGRNDTPRNSSNKLENLRPEAFATSLLIRPVDPATEFSIIYDNTDENNAYYILLILSRNSAGDPSLARNVWFDRLSLRIVRQETFEPKGGIRSDTRYSNWQNYAGVPFPASIDINRPGDGYGVVMTVTKMDMNSAITDDKFVLQQPPGSQLSVLGASGAENGNGAKGKQ